jgi:hypothetical protein
VCTDCKGFVAVGKNDKGYNILGLKTLPISPFTIGFVEFNRSTPVLTKD